MRTIKKRRVDMMLVLKDHEGRLQRIEQLLTSIFKEAQQEQQGLIALPTAQQTAKVAATKG